MKLLIVFALIAAACAAKLPQQRFNPAELDEIMAAINSPSTDPATAAALEQMLLDILGAQEIGVGPAIIKPDDIAVGPAIIKPDDIAVGPAIIKPEDISVGPAIIKPEDISVGPAIVNPDNISVGPAIVNPEEISVGPAIVQPVEDISVGPAFVDPAPASPFKGPLVQVIVNVNKETQSAVEVPAVIPPSPADVEEIKPDPVLVVDEAEPAIIVPENVNVVKPIFPDTAANLPDILN